MHAVELTAEVAGLGAAEVFSTLADFKRYPDLVEAVEEVQVLPAEADGSVLSTWVVHFRNGLLRWSESDTFDSARGEIAFRQLEGDFDMFEGGWSVRETAVGCQVVFRARFDFGVPSVASIVDPVAGRVLLENMEMITRGLFHPADVRVTTAEHGPDLHEAPSPHS
ncbi:SRPBCC family protein [Allokutzneria sp. A3M-2-11 16]|uniref:type II toxin-antitoxin system RatA family toxin n=1 Tax=Allokutzneria sp. A3M-2-11 16 TaxID=2962043 RepID=UPI0020B77884|nr:SRPBCC family protein [Allokutzneria sp. A3M-2-11 16]MCP3803317.1 SRPBCC family protein [Allokutzneria sp. A3M-2-11 16]